VTRSRRRTASWRRARGLHGRNSRIRRFRRLDQLLRAASRFAADVKVVADQVQERLVAGERRRSKQGFPIAAWFGLLDEGEHSRIVAGGLGIRPFAAGTDDHADPFDSGGNDFFDKDLQCRLLDPINVDEPLQQQTILGRTGGRDHGFRDLHRASPRNWPSSVSGTIQPSADVPNPVAPLSLRTIISGATGNRNQVACPISPALNHFFNPLLQFLARKQAVVIDQTGKRF